MKQTPFLTRKEMLLLCRPVARAEADVLPLRRYAPVIGPDIGRLWSMDDIYESILVLVLGILVSLRIRILIRAPELFKNSALTRTKIARDWHEVRRTAKTTFIRKMHFFSKVQWLNSQVNSACRPLHLKIHDFSNDNRSTSKWLFLMCASHFKTLHKYFAIFFLLAGCLGYLMPKANNLIQLKRLTASSQSTVLKPHKAMLQVLSSFTVLESLLQMEMRNTIFFVLKIYSIGPNAK